MLQEQRDGHRHQVERRLVIGREALHDLVWRAKECQHAVDGVPFQVRESAVANVGRVLVHDVVQNNLLARSVSWHAPKFLIRPKEGPTVSIYGRRRDLVPLPASSTQGGERGCAESSEIKLGRGTSYLVIWSCIQNQPQSSASFWCWDKPRATLDSLDSPQPGLGGSHHLPPFSILCVRPQRLHPNGIFSRDSQSGVPKLSRFGLLGLWANITFCPDLWSGQGLNQTCSSPQEIFNAMSHFTCWR